MAALIFGAFVYGKGQYRNGYADAQQHAQAQVKRIEQGMQYEKEKADVRLRAAILAREAAERDVAAARSRLDGLLSAHGRDPANPTASARTDGADPDWIGGFATCYAEYSALASDSAVWADRVNGLQDWARVVQRKANETP
ncbi:hypothetical protein Q9R35_00935 [Alcaligenes sp. AB3]|uniref:hypothetical protein n=1 Tax=Alcaligenes sp. AB3 TaxID=2962569 RepID=UPI002882639B|nr:hypothetical protein [Alcaligenes sp. AB3]MDT0215876.1 hypothetical protein [Alcaligenes sp. AB3]